jgi:hypothetical protein
MSLRQFIPAVIVGLLAMTPSAYKAMPLLALRGRAYPKGSCILSGRASIYLMTTRVPPALASPLPAHTNRPTSHIQGLQHIQHSALASAIPLKAASYH